MKDLIRFLDTSSWPLITDHEIDVLAFSSGKWRSSWGLWPRNQQSNDSKFDRVCPVIALRSVRGNIKANIDPIVFIQWWNAAVTWWRHGLGTFSALLTLSEGNPWHRLPMDTELCIMMFSGWEGRIKWYEIFWFLIAYILKAMFIFLPLTDSFLTEPSTLYYIGVVLILSKKTLIRHKYTSQNIHLTIFYGALRTYGVILTEQNLLDNTASKHEFQWRKRLEI